ncbi:MAG: altronate dehydratase [Desulfobacteraceae bacterium]|nr:altronate dehydratase [Desulfobacteraceae bacterium]
MNDQRPLIIRLNAQDNVAVALHGLATGAVISKEGVVCREEIPAGHKVAVSEIRAKESIRKYGQIIGFATKTIRPGEWVHNHNMAMGDFARDYAICKEVRPVQVAPEKDRPTFDGILREDGRIATRNYVGVLSTVNCSASVGRFIADGISPHILAEFPHVDGVVSLGHGSGCGMVPDAEGFQLLQRTLAGYTSPPNFAGILLVGLGCEVNHVDCFLDNMNLKTGPFLQTIEIQGTAGTRDSVRLGIEAIHEMLPEANRVKREPLPVSGIVLGLECGGSDAYSGITANPALGAAADLLISYGGTAILSETPEIYGAEHLLTRRAISDEVGEKLIHRIRWWEEYTSKLGAEIDNNPTPGNKAGGLTTILEKSLGAVAKGGTTNLAEVYEYAEEVSAKGLVFMDTPGYDVASITGMVAGGANLICFTTGRGTVCGFKPVPTIKLASNTEMCSRLGEDMDMNCGLILDGKATVQEMGEAIFKLLIETASGKKTKSELLGFGDNEFVPWQMGPVM